jgi:hypothetical protein
MAVAEVGQEVSRIAIRMRVRGKTELPFTVIPGLPFTVIPGLDPGIPAGSVGWDDPRIKSGDDGEGGDDGAGGDDDEGVVRPAAGLSGSSLILTQMGQVRPELDFGGSFPR